MFQKTDYEVVVFSDNAANFAMSSVFFENLCGDEETVGGIAGFMTFFSQSLSFAEMPIFSI